MLMRILPSWVQPDPLRSRAIDPLGLQLISDRFADRMLPGLSVLTTRARYFTFLCWARRETGSTSDEREIHRQEVRLTLMESRLSADEVGHSKCSFVGKRNIEAYLREHRDEDVLATDPRTIYKVPVWRAYRASMVQLGLLEGSPRYALTEPGRQAASAFRKAVGSTLKRMPPQACLSRIRESSREKRLLRDSIGLSLRGKLEGDWGSTDARRRRAAFGRLMRKFSPDGEDLNPRDPLSYFEGKTSASLGEPENTVRAAAVWEYLSLGLNLVFVAWVRAVDVNEFNTFRKALRRSSSARRMKPSLSDVALQDNNYEVATARAIACLSRAAAMFYQRLPEQSRCLLPGNPFDLARRFVDRRVSPNARIDEILQELLFLHQNAKGDEAWLQVPDPGRLDRFTVNRDTKKSWQPPNKVTVHGYRIPQFGQIVHDLGGF
jgi:hypothetical protein